MSSFGQDKCTLNVLVHPTRDRKERQPQRPTLLTHSHRWRGKTCKSNTFSYVNSQILSGQLASDQAKCLHFDCIAFLLFLQGSCFVCLPVRRIRLYIGFQAFKIAIHVSLNDGHTRCLLCWDKGTLQMAHLQYFSKGTQRAKDFHLCVSTFRKLFILTPSQRFLGHVNPQQQNVHSYFSSQLPL